ncbi:hypothetical protein E2C01_065491 [Portunus trituberculatus]|uniref:Uncharacterized protein n=1 Tax=Portunus trituberculatus TaxID=210409 RepID=A0A5B7HNA7_PORTR|nr:hypothetical protein [Portunus trituberculatus]
MLPPRPPALTSRPAERLPLFSLTPLHHDSTPAPRRERQRDGGRRKLLIWWMVRADRHDLLTTMARNV